MLSAGMERSASTWMYNVARLLIQKTVGNPDNFSFGWIGGWHEIPRRQVMLIKLHEYNQSLVDQSCLVFYSYRDIRDVVASMHRMFQLAPSIDVAEHFIKQDMQWSKVADYSMRYEHMIERPDSIVRDIARVLGVDDVDEQAIIDQVNALKFESAGDKNVHFNQTTMYHKNHILDGRFGAWKDHLDRDLVKQIEIRFSDWLTSHNYPIGN